LDTVWEDTALDLFSYLYLDQLHKNVIQRYVQLLWVTVNKKTRNSTYINGIFIVYIWHAYSKPRRASLHVSDQSFEDFSSHELQNPKYAGATDSAFLLLACISNLACAPTNINLWVWSQEI